MSNVIWDYNSPFTYDGTEKEIEVSNLPTDFSVTYDENGVEYKTFNVKDGHGIVRANKSGFITAIITARNKEYNAAIIYIDGMVESKTINESVLKPLMLRNRANTYVGEDKEVISEFNNNDVIIRKIKKFNLENYIYNHLIPQNDVTQIEKFEEAFSSINMGNCILLVDTLDIAYDLDVKGFNQRSINSPQNEIVVRGSQEAFVENIRTNTSMVRRLVNNENLIIENCNIGEIMDFNLQQERGIYDAK